MKIKLKIKILSAVILAALSACLPIYIDMYYNTQETFYDFRTGYYDVFYILKLYFGWFFISLIIIVFLYFVFSFIAHIFRLMLGR